MFPGQLWRCLTPGRHGVPLTAANRKKKDGAPCLNVS